MEAATSSWPRIGGSLRATLLLLASGACGAPGLPTVQMAPVAAFPPGGAGLAQLAFLTGCWRGAFGQEATVIEERWTPPAGGMMLVTTRFLREGRVVDFEFGTLTLSEGEALLTPYPGGDQSPHAFRLTRGSPSSAVFEAPEHDYPKRIVYQRAVDGALLARIDAGESDPEPRTWSLAAVPCP